MTDVLLEGDLRSPAYPDDICCAAVQCLQVLEVPRDPFVRSMLVLARLSRSSTVRQLAVGALSGEVIPLPSEPDAEAGS